jgi:hypothetical protein
VTKKRGVTSDFAAGVSVHSIHPRRAYAATLALTRRAKLALSRVHLARALQLGLGEFFACNPENSVLFQDERRQFITMPLSKELAVAHSQNAVCLISTEAVSGAKPKSPRRPTKLNEPNTPDTPTTNGEAASNGAASPVVPQPRKLPRPRKAKGTGLGALIDEAEALKNSLRDIFGQAKSLTAALKRQRKQNRLVQSSLKALKELQSVE